jgi:transposase InsO family protein
MTALETASVILNHIGRFGSPEIIHTDQGPAFHYELVHKLLRLCGIEHSFATAYSSEENGIAERANQEVLQHLRAILFDNFHRQESLQLIPPPLLALLRFKYTLRASARKGLFILVRSNGMWSYCRLVICMYSLL